MSLENVKKSLVILDQSLDTLEEVIERRHQQFVEAKNTNDVLARQIDMFNEQQAASQNNNFDKQETVAKLDQVISQINDMLEA